MKKLFYYALMLALVCSFTIFGAKKAGAAALTAVSDRMTNHTPNELSSHTIVFTLGGSTAFDTTETITVDFDEDGSGFDVDGANSAIADFDFNDGIERVILDVGVGAPDCSSHVAETSDIAVGINDATGVVTFEACADYAAQAAGATVNIEYGTDAGGTDRVTNPTPAVDDVLIGIAGTIGDSGTLAVSIYADDIVATGTLGETMSCALSTNTFSLTMSAGVVAAASPITITISTNALSGYVIRIRDSNQALKSAYASNYTIDSVVGAAAITLVAGTEGYGAQGVANDGQTLVAPYDGTVSDVGQLKATDENFMTQNAAADAETGTVNVKAAVANDTPAATDYTDTITMTCYGIF